MRTNKLLALQIMERIEPFNAQKLEAACRVLADTERGLTGSELGYLIQDCKNPRCCSNNDQMEETLQRAR